MLTVQSEYLDIISADKLLAEILGPSSLCNLLKVLKVIKPKQ